MYVPKANPEFNFDTNVEVTYQYKLKCLITQPSFMQESVRSVRQ